MAELKTKKTEASVDKFLAGLADAGRREDALNVCKLMQQASKQAPKMWGGAIVGFGSRKLVYESGRELDWMEIGFSPRKANTVLYLAGGQGAYAAQLARLGKHKTGKGCLYINSLADVDAKVLKEIIQLAVKNARK
jgi:hypothetical protein